MTTAQIIHHIRNYANGFLDKRSSVERRINELQNIEMAAQNAREELEGVLLDLDEKDQSQ